VLWAHSNDEATEKEVERMLSKLATKWKITREDEVTSIIGITINRLTDGSMVLTQPGDLNKLRKEFFAEGAPVTVQSIMTGYEKHSKFTEEDLLPVEDQRYYQHCIGQIQYMRFTRRDIKLALSMLASHNKMARVIDHSFLLEPLRV
jgi:hypothetical protein